MTSYRKLVGGVALVAAFALQGCYVAPAPTPVPAPQRSISERFEQSWKAAKGAAYDSGVKITSEDRPGGTLRGNKGSTNVVITVITQADATIQVGFAVNGGGASQESMVKENLTRAYQARMGR